MMKTTKKDRQSAALQAIQPADPRLPELLLLWYTKNARALPWRADRKPYHVWISEIMLQQTRAETVAGYYTRFLFRLPDIAALAQAGEEELLKLWEGLGYYNRVRNLQKAARLIMEKYDGVFPSKYADIRALPGIGDYTAGAISSICFEQPQPAIDGNVLRVYARLTASDLPIDLITVKKQTAAALAAVYPAGHCGDFTQSLMELGATVCVPRTPKCGACPVRSICTANQKQIADKLPVKQPKKEKRVEWRTVFFFRCEDKIALCKRKQTGLLSGLWQLPDLPGTLSVKEALEKAGQFGVCPTAILREIHRAHIFTHIRWEMTCFVIDCGAMPNCFTWAAAEEIGRRYALPTAYRQFLSENEPYI